MSTQFNLETNQPDLNNSQAKVRVTDLLSRMNEERKIEKKKKLSSWCSSSFSCYSFRNNINNLNSF